MATKDWEKSSNNVWRKKKNFNEFLMIYNSPQSPKTIFYVYIDDKDTTSEKRFDSIGQALAYAKSYMRSH